MKKSIYSFISKSKRDKINTVKSNKIPKFSDYLSSNNELNSNIKVLNHYSDLKNILQNDKIEFKVNPMSMIKEELSEEEFVSSKLVINNQTQADSPRDIRFRSPPQSKAEIEDTLKEVEDIYSNSKHFLFNSNPEYQLKRMKESYTKNIPFNMHFKHLSLFPNNSVINKYIDNCDIYVIGVKEESDIHANYIYNLLEITEPDSILLTLSPDNSLFINPESCGSQKIKKNADDAWKHYLTFPSDEASFYVSSLPKNLNNITFTPDAIKNFIDINCEYSHNIKKAPKVIYSKSNKLLEKRLYDIESSIRGADSSIAQRLEYFGNSYLTAALYSYNSLIQNKYSNIILADFPKIEEIKYAVNDYYIKNLQDQFVALIDNINKENYDFDPMINLKYVDSPYPSENKYSFSNVRAKYITEVIKQSAIGKKNIVVICDFKIIDDILKEWENIELFKETADNKIEFNITNLDDFYLKRFNNIENSDLDSFNFFEKTVLIDFLSNCYMSENYIKHKVFPLNYDEILYKAQKKNNNEKNLYSFVTSFLPPWEYYFSQYYKKYTSETILVEKNYRDYLKKYNTGFGLNAEDLILNNKI